MADSTNRKQFSTRDLIWACTLVISFSASFFPMKAKVDRIEKAYEENNPVLINYRLGEIEKKVNNINTKFDGFITSFNKYAAEHGN